MTDIAARLGVSESETRGDPTIQLLRQIGGDDPRLHMLAEILRRQQAASGSQTDTQTAFERMAARCERLKQAYQLLRARNDSLAAALGACPRCWGEDDECPMCEGRGAAGAYQPRPDAFEAYVVPAVGRFRSRMTRARPAVHVSATPRNVPGADRANRREE